MRKTVSGFTIVELLIVIVVIAILAAISIVAFNGVQARGRDSVRYADAKAIIKALELYKVDNGQYPPTSATSVAGQGSTGCVANGYSYSWGVDTNWMKPLVDGGYLKKVPLPPINDCASHYRYLHPSATSYNCPSRTSGYYILEVVGVETMPTPAEAHDPAGGGNWVPCTGATAGWGAGASRWIFTEDD